MSIESLTHLLKRREAAVGLCLLATLAGVAAINPAFLSGANAADLLTGCAAWVIIACGVALVVITGEIDISVGSMYGLLAVMLGVLTSPTHAHWPPGLAIATVLAAGAGLGLVNGLLVTVGKVPSIIVTLGMLTALRGGMELVLGGHWVTDMPGPVRALGTQEFWGLRVNVYVAALVAAGVWWLLTQMPAGRRLYAVGSDAEAARLAGVSAGAMRTLAFTLSGLLTAVAALVTAPQLSVIESGMGLGWELVVITAVVVGGVSIRGGSGSITGVVLAALLLGIIRSALVFLKLGPAAAFWERAIQGVFILAAVTLDRGALSHAGLAGLRHHLCRPGTGRGFALPHWALLTGLLLGWMAFAAWSRPEFVTLETQVGLSTQAAEVALLAVPMTLIMLTGGIDLSVGSTMALSAVVIGLMQERGSPERALMSMALLTGALCGAVNGMFIVRWKIHPLIVTLATLSLYRGLAEGMSAAQPVSGFSGWFTELAARNIALLPAVLVPAVLAFAGAAVILWRGVAGRNIRATGFNETACRFCGIGVDRLKFTLYTLSGAAAGLAAVILVARRNTAKADAGMGIELDVITAVVLGGTSVSGGSGSIIGTLAGVLLLHEVRQFIAWRWYHDESIAIAVGLVLIVSVLAGRLLRGGKTE